VAIQRVHLPVVTSLAPAPTTSADPLLDSFERRVRYLRISVTDRCNYRCSYCMPPELADGIAFSPHAALLTFEELERLARVFAQLGVRKLRLTGGEPTVRNGIVDLVRRLARVPGIDQVAMTTNGHLLAELAGPLREAGLSSINVSLDTLDPDRFRTVTLRGDLARVLAGIDAAVAAGLRVATNAVAQRGLNDDELVALCEDAWRRGATPRFIEHMPMSDGALYDRGATVSAAMIRGAIERAHGALIPADAARDAGPARYWAVAASPAARFGIISAMTEHFCDDCNRLRLTSTGELHACLGHDDAVSLRDVIRSGAGDDAIVRAIAGAVTHKRAGHVFADAPPAKHMIGIGG
jgi:GTP 3',8-cyclase